MKKFGKLQFRVKLVFDKILFYQTVSAIFLPVINISSISALAILYCVILREIVTLEHDASDKMPKKNA